MDFVAQRHARDYDSDEDVCLKQYPDAVPDIALAAQERDCVGGELG